MNPDGENEQQGGDGEEGQPEPIEGQEALATDGGDGEADTADESGVGETSDGPEGAGDAGSEEEPSADGETSEDAAAETSETGDSAESETTDDAEPTDAAEGGDEVPAAPAVDEGGFAASYDRSKTEGAPEAAAEESGQE